MTLERTMKGDAVNDIQVAITMLNRLRSYEYRQNDSNLVMCLGYIHDALTDSEALNTDLLEALENLLRCSEYKATDYCGTCVPAAKEAIQKARG